MSCDTNTHRVTVLGDLDMHHQGRHRRDKDDDKFDALRDILEMKEVLETKFAAVKETIEAKADVLKAVAEVGAAVLKEGAETRSEVKEAKHDLAILILKAENERLRDECHRPRGRDCRDH